ncbi:MAG TPA: hypothetical protein DF699_06470, partial [Phycisphaerales bacterium]|nr:hypothetical protein [Phycisphaerales bacterium]
MRMRSENTQPLGLWWVVFSITLGSIIIGVFLPIFLLLAALCTLVIPVLAARDLNHSRSIERELNAFHEEAELEQSREMLLRGLFDAADIPIIATDEGGSLVRSNNRANAVLGIDERMIGRRIDELLTQRVLHELEQLARGGEPGHARASLAIR